MKGRPTESLIHPRLTADRSILVQDPREAASAAMKSLFQWPCLAWNMTFGHLSPYHQVLSILQQCSLSISGEGTDVLPKAEHSHVTYS